MLPRETFLEIAGVRTRVLEAGAGEGPPVVFLHGAGSPGVWNDWHEAIAARHRLIAPDHPGFGESDRPDWLLGIDDMVFFYLDFLDHLALGRVHLVGASVGGWIAAELATVQPERVERLVLVAAAGLYAPDLPMADMFLATPEELTALVFHDPSALPAPSATPELAQRRYKGMVTMARLAWSPYLHDPKLSRRLARVRAETLIVWGENDRLIPSGYAELYRRLIPRATVALVPRCGHSAVVERPKELAALVGDFLAGGRSPAR